MKYDQQVWQVDDMDELRKTNCMCLNCANFKPNEEDHCKIASDLFNIAKVHGNAFMMTRCGEWKIQEG